jgi:transporter family protein
MDTGWLAAAPRTPRFYAVSLRGLLLIVLEAALATVFGDLAYYAALKKGHCAETSLILSASPAVTVLLSAIVLGERPSSWSLAGAAFIAIGLALVGLQPRS